MARHRKSEQADTGPNMQEQNTLRIRFRGQVLELTVTKEYPIHVLQTEEYEGWINALTNSMTKARITSNVNKLRRGLLGDWKEVGAGVFEMRLDFGPGYRVYYAKQGTMIVILLGGGEKSGQQKDITSAHRLWGELKGKQPSPKGDGFDTTR